MLLLCGPRHLGSTLWIALGLALCAQARADDVRNLIEQALDQPIESIEIRDQPFPTALVQLERETGVPFQIAEAVLEQLPYGDRTRINLAIENLTLRAALRDLFTGFGLEIEVRADYVEIVPGPVLRRLSRRLTIAEVALLQQLADPTVVVEPAALPLRPELPVDSERWQSFTRQLSETQRGSALQRLESASRALDLVWLPAEEDIVVRTALADVQRRLAVSQRIEYQGVPLDELLLDLGRRVGVTMHFEPGLLAEIGAAQRNVNLIQQRSSVKQSLELLSGTIGLRYVVSADGVHIAASDAAGDGSTPREGRIGRLLRIAIPIEESGVSIAYIVREEDLPRALREVYAERLQQLLDELAQRSASAEP